MAPESGTVTTKWIKHCVATLGMGQFFLVLLGPLIFWRCLVCLVLTCINHLICLVLTYPSEKYAQVSWDDDLPNIWKNISHVPNHQPVFSEFSINHLMIGVSNF